MYPLDEQPNFDDLLDDMRDLRIEQEPEDQVYYLALSPVESAGFGDGIGFQAEADEAEYRVAISTSSDDAEYTSLVAGHELGHNHRLSHSPGCDPGDPGDDYPYDDGILGIWAYDGRKKALIAPVGTWDIMSYCDPVWFSDYTYRQVVERVAHVNGNQHVAKSFCAKHDWRVLLVAPNGQTRWGRSYTGRTPARAPEAGNVLDAQGEPVALVNVYRIPTDAQHATTVVIPSPAPGWASIQLEDTTAARFE